MCRFIGSPNKIKGLMHFAGVNCACNFFLYTPLRTDHKICYNVIVFKQGRGFGRGVRALVNRLGHNES